MLQAEGVAYRIVLVYECRVNVGILKGDELRGSGI